MLVVPVTVGAWVVVPFMAPTFHLFAVDAQAHHAECDAAPRRGPTTLVPPC